MPNVMPLLFADGYKLDHRRQYPPHTSRVYSNWTPRQSRVAGQSEVAFFGLQYFLAEFMMYRFERDFFERPTKEIEEVYSRRVDGYLGPNGIGVEHIAALHRLGYLPLEFRAVLEGTFVPLRVPMLSVENTHPDFFWLPNYIETLMSCELWLPCTSATTASQYRRILDAAALRTGTIPEFVNWQGHDFSFRGMEGVEAAMKSGAAHLLFFTGTDTIPAIDWIQRYYGPLPADYLIGGSVAATEHSVMCAGGERGELETIGRLLDLYPGGVLSVVSDTWDLWNVLTDILPKLRSKIMAREGKYVTRPDSGDPVRIICGDPDAPNGTPASKGVIELLWETFGGTITATGHKMLDSHVGAIYGDSITQDRALAIVQTLEADGFASGNVVFGIGSYTYQYVTRDTYGFAMKATWVEIDGGARDIFKTPKTDDGMKNSAKGRLAVLYGSDGRLRVVNQATPEQENESELRLVWRDGEFFRRETYDSIRARAHKHVEITP